MDAEARSPADATARAERRFAWGIVTVSWNARDETLRCLESLERTGGPDVRIVCVDNGSTDGSAEAIRERHPDVDLVENGRNLGFAGGNNVGLRHALSHGAEWVLMVNNDAVMAPDALEAFERATAVHPRAGILTGKVYLGDPPSSRLWFAGARAYVGLGYSGRPRGWGREDGPRYRRLEPTGRAVGAFMAVSRQLIETVGLFDEGLFAYVEDVELSARARRAGFEVLFVPGAMAWHRVSATGGGEFESTHNIYYGVRNTIAVAERFRPLPVPLTRLRRLFIRGVFTVHALRRPDRRRMLGAVADGYGDLKRGRFGERPAESTARW
jgi:GT2 family glycosyltransferase